MAYGKQIDLFLVDGTVDGIVEAKVWNWSGRAAKVPCAELPAYTNAELAKPGVYFRICRSDDGEPGVYIGESTNVLRRLKKHPLRLEEEGKSFYCTAVVAFAGGVDKNCTLYVEHQLVERARSAGRYRVLTKATTDDENVENSLKAVLAEYIDNISVLMDVLGYRVLVEAPRPGRVRGVLHCGTKQRDGAHATGYLSANGFTVEAGSTITGSVVKSFPKNARKRLVDLKAAGIVQGRTFVVDYEFSSPSMASDIVLGSSTSGPREWKNDDGVSLGELEG